MSRDTSRWSSRWRLLGAVALVLGAVGVAGVSVAHACGMFRSRKVAPEERPTMSREKVLLVYDAAKGEEHFIREVAFARAGEPLGFVVPTPTRPSVGSVKATPFTSLRNAFPFQRLAKRPTRGSGPGTGLGGFGVVGKGVTVLEVEQVGSFKAFVLHATDEDALAKWLAENDLVASEAASSWLAHYVRMNFYYVAMRYDPPRKRGRAAKDEPPISAETIRITFATPAPYYPYLEPSEPKLPDESPRLLEVWTVGAEAVVPVALHEHGDTRQWVRPLKLGETYDDARGSTLLALAEELHAWLPEGPVVVQTFQDQKRSRSGFGDIVFVPQRARALDAERVAALQPMLGLLDPSLGGTP